MKTREYLLFLLAILLVIAMFSYIIYRGEQLATNPCSLCAQQLGDTFTCYSPSHIFGQFNKQTFHYNGSLAYGD